MMLIDRRPYNKHDPITPMPTTKRWLRNPWTTWKIHRARQRAYCYQVLYNGVVQEFTVNPERIDDPLFWGLLTPHPEDHHARCVEQALEQAKVDFGAGNHELINLLA